MYFIILALAVFVCSPSAYEALKSFNVLQLPSRSTLQAYTGAFLHEAGASLQSIAQQVEKFKYLQYSLDKAHITSKFDGVLIFDEVKVISSLMWNSKDHRIVGLAMTEKEQASLHDVFQNYSEDHRVQQTSYILQFLWRDLTSSFDIIGPYFTSDETMTAKKTYACVMETVKIFQVHINNILKLNNDLFIQVIGLKTSLLICDGASSNLTTLKATHGHSGMYGISDTSDPYRVQPWFINPYNPPNHIYWLICPSHQVIM